MENELWSKYLDSAVSGIRDKKTKAEVREELLDHLEDRKERFLRFGDSEEEAAEKALGTMGDSDKLRVQLGEIHSKVPVEDLNSALSKIFIGFIFTFFTIKLGGIDVVKPIGSLLVFMGMYQLRKINPKLKKAWVAEIGLLVWCVINVVLPAIPFYSSVNDSGWIYAITAFGSVLNIVRTALLFLGIDDLRWAVYRKDETVLYEPRMIRALIAYVIMYVIMFFSVLLGFAYVMFAIAPIMVYILYQLRKTQVFIHKSNYRTENIEKFDGRGAGILAGLFALFVVAGAVTMYAVATPKVKSEPVNEVKTEEVNIIREELINNGFPKNLAYMLPDEEIKKCYPFDKESNILTSTNKAEMSLGPRVYTVAVPLEYESGEELQDVQYFYGFKYLDCENIRGYRDSFLAHEPFFPIPGETTYGIYYKQDGALYKQKPLRVHRSNYNEVDGLEYRTVKDAEEMYGYISVRGTSASPNNHRSMHISYVMGKHWWNYPHYSAFKTYGMYDFDVSANDMANNTIQQFEPQFLADKACYKYTFHLSSGHEEFERERKDFEKKFYKEQALESE